MRVAEFFAGIGLVRMALEPHGFRVVWANDVDPAKHDLYRRNFDVMDYVLSDIRDVRGGDLPDVELATASFPCTDLSLAGNRRGLAGGQSGMFWEFTRVLEELNGRRPGALLIENVPGFGSSRGGDDLRLALGRLNELDYCCDLLVADARWFVPQSRQRLFIVGLREPPACAAGWEASALRPAWIGRFVARHPELWLRAQALPPPGSDSRTLADVVERLPADDPRWWEAGRLARLRAELSPIQAARLARLADGPELTWAAAYRRTRQGRPAWEIRRDALSGCLRTARGGSSRQALVEAGGGATRARWMTGREYARLQGAPEYDIDGVPEGRARFGFGDAVCVPVVGWLAETYLARVVGERRDD